MKRVTTPLCLVLLMSWCLSASINAQDAPKGDKANIEGVWIGTVQGDRGSEEVSVEFKGDAFTLYPSQGNSATANYKISRDKSQAQIDFEAPSGTQAGIYELKGDGMKICFSKPKAPRPSAFKATNYTVLITLKRQKGATPTIPSPPVKPVELPK